MRASGTSREGSSELSALAQELLAAVVALVVEQVRDEGKDERTSGGLYMTSAEAAEYLRCSVQRVYDLRSSRRLSRYVEGGRALLLRAEVESLVTEEP